MEDTVAQYETLDGQSHVQPSNPVYLYAPRFGAVRQVTNLQDEVQIDRLRSLHEPQVVRADDPHSRGRGPAGPPGRRRHRHAAGEHLPRKTGLRPSSAPSGRGRSRTATRRSRTSPSFARRDQGVGRRLVGPGQRRRRRLDHEASRAGPPRTSRRRGQQRRREAGDGLHERPPADAAAPHHQARLDSDTKPGETVDFTIRFDNLGLQAIGSVVILDSLSSGWSSCRTAQCSLEARVSTQPNESDSLLVRCELVNPLKPGKGGVLRLVPRAVGTAHGLSPFRPGIYALLFHASHLVESPTKPSTPPAFSSPGVYACGMRATLTFHFP